MSFPPQLHQNVKKISFATNKITLILKDNRVITLDQMSSTLARKTNDYLEKLMQGKTSNWPPLKIFIFF